MPSFSWLGGCVRKSLLIPLNLWFLCLALGFLGSKWSRTLGQHSPTFLALGTGFMEDSFSANGVGGEGFGMILTRSEATQIPRMCSSLWSLSSYENLMPPPTQQEAEFRW